MLQRSMSFRAGADAEENLSLGSGSKHSISLGGSKHNFWEDGSDNDLMNNSSNSFSIAEGRRSPEPQQEQVRLHHDFETPTNDHRGYHPSSPISTSASSSSSSSSSSASASASSSASVASAVSVSGAALIPEGTTVGAGWHQQETTASQQQPPADTLVFTARNQKSTFSILIFGFCLVGFALYSSSRANMSTALVRISSLAAMKQRTRAQILMVEKDVKHLGRQISALHLMRQKREDAVVEKTIRSMAAAYTHQTPTIMEEMKAMQSKLKLATARAETLKMQVQTNSREETIRKFGAGIKRVRLELLFPGGVKGPTALIMEMAPLELMPHSVHMFLEMAHSGLLDGCSFIMNALHVLKAAPLPYDGSPATDKTRDFSDYGLESVAFQEYSPSYPHTKYTVGFAADGSPSFYINTQDNSQIHEGDPCFAKIVSGFDTVRRLEATPTRNGIWFEHRIGIKRAVVL